MKIGELVQWTGLNGKTRDWKGIGIVIDIDTNCPHEVRVLWSSGSKHWYFERRLTIITRRLP